MKTSTTQRFQGLGYDQAALAFCQAAYVINPQLWVEFINSDSIDGICLTPMITGHQLLTDSVLDELLLVPVERFAETAAEMLYCPVEGVFPEGFLEMLSGAEHAVLASAPDKQEVSYEDLFMEWAESEFGKNPNDLYVRGINILMGTVTNVPATHPRDVLIHKLSEADEVMQLTPYVRRSTRQVAAYIHESWLRSDMYAELSGLKKFHRV